MPNVTRGDRMAGLMSYLVGPGRSNEHTAPMVVAGDDRVLFEFETGAELSNGDALRIAAILDQPRRVHGTSVRVPVREWDEARGVHVKTGERDAHVWHCSLSLKADEGKLDPKLWNQVATAFVDRMGFIDPDGAKSSRWVAVHHGTSKAGNDHIHIAVQMVREDGTKTNTHNDFSRSQKVCAELEREFGLQVVETREHGKGLAGEKPAEAARAHREDRPLSAPYELRRRMRAALASSQSPAQYVQRLRDLNVLVEPSFQKGSTTRVRGYRVALPAVESGDGKSIRYTPSKLDARLGWPAILGRFDGQGAVEGEQELLAGRGAQGVHPTRRHPIAPEKVDALISGKKNMGPDDLAQIYARLSLQLEPRTPGPLFGLSEQFARVGQSPGSGAYAVRLAARAGGRDGTRGWIAVMRQANRLSRTLTAQHLTTSRPQLAATTIALMEATVAISHRPATPQPTRVGSARPALLGRTATGRDIGAER
ncbi:relaxase/mobilization nuclease domain-containing protein [Micrococcus terreus]|nr:relaxase/mobilization nuclease domain-containing protein [Micrococcus terreus]